MKYLLTFGLCCNFVLGLLVITQTQRVVALESELKNLAQLLGHNFVTMDMDASCVAQLQASDEIRLQIISEE